MDTSYFNINDLQFKWGTTYKEVVSTLIKHHLLPPNYSALTFTINCNSVYNIKTIAVSTHVFDENKPIVKLSYQLDNTPSYDNIEQYTNYFNSFVELHYSNTDYNKEYYPRATGTRKLLMNYGITANLNDIKITGLLSVSSNDNISIQNFVAELWVEWKAPELGLKSLIEYYDDLSNKITHHFKESSIDVCYYKFNAEELLIKHISHFYKDNELQTTDLINNHNAFKTPNIVAQNLNANCMCLYKIDGLNLIFFSSLDYTICIDSTTQSIKYIYEDWGGVAPDRSYLKINDLITINKTTKGDYHTEAMYQLIKQIEELTGFKVYNK